MIGMKKISKSNDCQFYVDKSRCVYDSETDTPLEASAVSELYDSTNQSLTQFAGLLGLPKTGYGRRVANEILNHYGIRPRQTTSKRLASISFEEATQACSEAQSLTELGRKLGATTDSTALTLANAVVQKYGLDIEHFKWKSLDAIPDMISESDAQGMLDDSATLREMGQKIQTIIGVGCDVNALARKVIQLYHLDDTKFIQSKTDGMTRDDIMRVYGSASSNADFLQKLGYTRASMQQLVVIWNRFQLPLPGEPEWNDLLEGPYLPSSVLQEVASQEIRTIPYIARPETEKPATRRSLIKVRGYQCEQCGRTVWKGVPIPLQIHHINGDHYDNRWENVQLLCCNCHSQKTSKQQKTDERRKTRCKYSDEQLIQALQEHESYYATLVELRMSVGKITYNRCIELVLQHHIEPYYTELMEAGKQS